MLTEIKADRRNHPIAQCINPVTFYRQGGLVYAKVFSGGVPPPYFACKKETSRDSEMSG